MSRCIVKQIVLGVFVVVSVNSCTSDDMYSQQGKDPGNDPQAGKVNPVPASDTFTARFTQQTDILAVVDNSGSMSDKIQTVKDSLDSFHQIINSRRLNNYRFAAVTVDVVGNNGSLVSYQNQDIVDSSTTDAVTAVKNILGSITSTPHSYWEQGMVASMSALKKNGSRFLRDGADLALITLTDADDYSCKSSITGDDTGLDCLSAANASNTSQPEKITSLWTPIPLDDFQSYYKSLNRSVLYYAMVGTPDTSCNEEHKGLRYIQLQKMLGTGFIQPICINTLSNSFLQIASEISARGDCYHLKATVFSTDQLRVKVNQTGVPLDASTGFIFDSASNSVCFRGSFLPPAGSAIEVDYETVP